MRWEAKNDFKVASPESVPIHLNVQKGSYAAGWPVFGAV